MAPSPHQNPRHGSPAPPGRPRRVLVRILWLPALALAGGLVLPVVAYMAGKRVIGAYEGRLGLQDYLGSIYGAAGRGEPLAWLLLLAPALVAALWWGIVRLWRET